MLVIWPSPLAGRRGRPVDALAWPRRTADKTAAGRRSIFRALDGWKLELARCDWSMYGTSAQTRCPLPYRHCTRFLTSTCGLPRLARLRWYCRSREHSVACHHTPDLCSCQSFSPSISNVPETPTRRQGDIQQQRCGHSYQPYLWQWLLSKFVSDFLLSTLLALLTC